MAEGDETKMEKGMETEMDGLSTLATSQRHGAGSHLVQHTFHVFTNLLCA